MSPERRGGESRQEIEPLPYYRAARFSGERPAGSAYFQAQALIFDTPDSDLSVYRLQLNYVWHVAVLGEQPHEVLQHQIDAILFTGGSSLSRPISSNYYSSAGLRRSKEDSG
ncbi:MAG: hypothetical protein HY675_14570 [Chloroflexi bacterium]|nr:hypothetical protein [Chloroflexota bacterium]